MTNFDFLIREIKVEDNEQVAKIVRSVILEMGAPKIGTAYEDKATDAMFENYQKEKAIYYVVEHNNKIVGGAGIAQLDNFEGSTCELQKMYFLPITRGKGIGKKLIEKCLQKAKELGFDECYLETMPYMTAAQKLYLKNGFTKIDAPKGNTCHYSCDVWMIKKI
jgi:putative acetyltransferase